MKPSNTTGTTLRTPPFVLANEVLNIYAEGAKTYWRAWGPVGRPAVETVEVWVRYQRLYLEALEAFVAPPTSPRVSRKAANDPLRASLRDLFTGGLGVGFED